MSLSVLPTARHAARIVLIAAALFAGSAVAAARDDLNSFTRGLKGLEGQFTQQVFDANGKRKEASSGNLALSAPRLFRWEYVKPYPQLIVADGKKVWVHDPDLQQVTVRPQGAEEQNSPLSALIDPAKLDAQFVVKDAGKADGLNWLSLAPKGNAEANFRTAKLGFDGNGLARMQVVDSLGQRTEVVFSGWKRNPGFAAGKFKFVPPAGTDVIGER
ncbi:MULTISPECIES: outer membrane lipoprotein chaperone LolA [unclassified Lysobacter]|uniref:outer membrane lipoprotein chaperone LolA n=1 Tax=unclassified Lysobacter TaxID=2635362 RepID=UPI00070E2C5D|nr:MULTISPECIES: outer membrane lipoprotein chaperone LolA [unclassified Lysobacter]KRD39785.1 outer membrane lipoprotein carrier protein LolA [Lysobacter sp. Root916]KRD79807.1 outer membrane lipoprotein carrier protein LolA [Lysobacter sp. Root983]